MREKTKKGRERERVVKGKREREITMNKYK